MVWLLLLPPFLLQPAERRAANEGTCSAEVAVAVLLPEVELPFKWIWGWVGHLSLDKGCTRIICYREAVSKILWRCLQWYIRPTGMLILSWRTNNPAVAAAQTCTKPASSLLLFKVWLSFISGVSSLLHTIRTWLPFCSTGTCEFLWYQPGWFVFVRVD